MARDEVAEWLITLVSYNDTMMQVEQTKQTHAHICSALIVLNFLSATIG